MLFRSMAISVLCFLAPFASAQSHTLVELATGRVEMVTCPAVGEDYAQLLAQIDAMKASIKNQANCKQVSDSLDNRLGPVEKERARFLDLIRKAQTTPLSEAEAKEIGDYAASVTQTVGGLIDLISNSSTCFSGDANKQALNSLSGLVSEAASLISSVAGPWGAPISIGGEVISGFLTGLDKVVKARAGYDFSDRTQWTSYVQNVCTYYALHQNIEALLHPDKQIARLQSISRKLDENMSLLATTQDTEASTQSVALNARVKNAQAWVQSEIVRVQSDANSYWNNVTGKDVLSQAAQEMEDFLFNKEAPQFLSFQMLQSNRGFDDLKNYLYWNGSTLLHQAHQAGLIAQEPAVQGSPIWGAGSDEAGVYQALTAQDWRVVYQGLHRGDDDLEYQLLNGRKLAREKFDTASWAFGVDDVFCDFFQQAGFYSPALHQVCTSTSFKHLNQKVTNYLGTAPRAWRPPEPNAIRAASWTEALDLWSTEVQKYLKGTW